MTRLINTRTGEIVVEDLLVRATFWGRFRGLLLRRKMDSSTAMLLVGTRKVHTLGMLFSLDLYFFDGSMRFIGSLFNVKPWTVPAAPDGTCHILEIQNSALSGTLQLYVGDQLSILWGLRP